MKKLLILLLLSQPAFALTAKEALVETKSARVALQKARAVQSKARSKEVIKETVDGISYNINQGECSYYMTFLDSSNEGLKLAGEYFENLGYEVVIGTGDTNYNMDISWCNSK